VNFFNVFFMACLIGPLFFFGDMARWQQIGYISGSALWLLNSFAIGSGILGFIAFVVLFASCIQVVVEHFPFRAG
jgi:hypothetical protein